MCRILARDHRQSMTVDAIASRCGLSNRSVIRLSKLHSWDSVRVGVALRFMSACGVDPLHTKQLCALLRRTRGSMPWIKRKASRKYLAQVAANH